MQRPQLEALKVPRIRWRPSNRCWADCCSKTAPPDRVASIVSGRTLQRRAPPAARRSWISSAITSRRTCTVGEALGSLRSSTHRRHALPRRAGGKRSHRGQHRRCENVRERAILRRLAAAGGEIADSAYHPLGRSVLRFSTKRNQGIRDRGTRAEDSRASKSRRARVVERINFSTIATTLRT